MGRKYLNFSRMGHEKFHRTPSIKAGEFRTKIIAEMKKGSSFPQSYTASKHEVSHFILETSGPNSFN